MSLTIALRTALSGIQASQLGLQVTSNNIANVNTEGFSRKTAVQSPRVVGGAGAGVLVEDVTRTVDKFLAGQLRDQEGVVARQRERERFLSQIQSFFGTPSSNDSIAAGVTGLNNSLETLALTPESSSARFNAVNDARLLSLRLNDLSKAVQQLRLDADQSIRDSIASVDTQLSFIGELNAKIARANAVGQPTGDLADQRDAALKKVATEIDIRTLENADGTLTIFTGAGRTLLTGDTSLGLSHSSVAGMDATLAYVQPGDAAYPGPVQGIFIGTPDLVNGTNDITNAIQSGSVAGLVELRDTLLPNLQREIDRLSAVMSEELNAVHNRGTAVPPPSVLTGTQSFRVTDAFTATGTVRISVLNQAAGTVVEFVDINLAGLGATATVADVAAAINAGLTGNPASIDAQGKLVIQAQAAGQGIAINEGDSAVAVVGGDTRGFSHFFGLNDLFDVTVPNSSYAGFASAPQASGTAALGIAGTLTFRFDGTAGTTINYVAGNSLEAVAAAINANATLAAQNITARVTDDSGGRRLTIANADGNNFNIADSGALLSTLNLAVDDTNMSRKIAVKAAVANNADLVARGELAATAAVGDIGVSIGDGTVANDLAGVFSTDFAFVEAGGLNPSTTSLLRYASEILNLQASLTGEARDNLTFNEVFLETVAFRQSSDSGVNIDEELANLIILEQAFAASARVLTVASDLLETLINSVR